MAEKKNKVRLPEKPKYPKHLVYPENGREVSLEQIRARLPRYRQVESELGTDMEMTTVMGTGHITEQVPLFPSLDRGKRLLLQPKLLEASVDAELERLNREKPLILSGGHPKVKPTRHLLEEEDPDRELEQLMLEKVANPPASARLVAPASENTADLMKENGPVAMETSKRIHHPTPGDDPISAKCQVVTGPAVSEAAPSKAKKMLNMLAGKENAALTMKNDFYSFTPSGTNHPLMTQPHDSGLPNIMAKLSFSDASMSNQSSVTQGFLVEEGRPSQLDAMMDWERKAKLASEQQDFEAQFMCGYTEFETKASSAVQSKRKRQPLQVIEWHEPPLRDHSAALGGAEDVSSFSVFQDPSKSASQFSRSAVDNDNAPGQPNQQSMYSFSAFEDPSVANITGQPSGRRADERSLTSFSAYEDPSIANASRQIPSQSIAHSATTSAACLGDKSISNSRNSERQESSIPHALRSVVDKENPVQPVVSSFGAFGDSGTADPGKHRSVKGTEERSLTSFSVYEDPSLIGVSEQAPSRSVTHYPVMTAHSHGHADLSKNRIAASSERRPLEVLEQKHPESTYDRSSAASSDWQKQQLQYLDGGQEVTQFDIRPANKFEPTSTPCPAHKGSEPVGVDFSVNFTSISILQPNPPPNPTPTVVQPPPTSVGGVKAGVAPVSDPPPFRELKVAPPFTHPEFTYHNKPLETIQEESRSSYGTASSSSSGASASSKLVASSNSSVGSTPGSIEPTTLGVQELRRFGVKVTSDGHINPFLSETIEYMLYSLPITSTKICHLNSSSPRFVVGSKVELCGTQHHIREKSAMGGFASIFVASTDKGLKALKVQSPPHSWEVAVVEEAHRLLRANNFHDVVQSIMQVEYVQIFSNSSVIVSPYHSFGTLLDLINKHRTAKKHIVEAMCVYYALELLRVVHALHSCGILHADIKPDNIMLRDTRQCSNYAEARGRGLCLVDFGRAIDTNSFPRGTQFVGSCNTDSFLCHEMRNDEAWTWQADLHAAAASIYVLLAKEYMKLSKTPDTGQCCPLVSLSRFYNKNYWEKVFLLLLNYKGAVDHTQYVSSVIEHMSTKLDLLQHRSFKTNLTRLWEIYAWGSS